jgi:DNA-directed RNA polymerase subunit K/omega
MSDSEEVVVQAPNEVEDYDSEYDLEGDEELDEEDAAVEAEAGADAAAATADPDQDAAISKYASIVRIVHPDDRMTSEVMSLYEQAECTGIRAQQIATYNNCLVDNNLSDPLEMAKFELMQRKCPLVLRRKVGELRENGANVEYFEEWDPNGMIFAVDYA